MNEGDAELAELRQKATMLALVLVPLIARHVGRRWALRFLPIAMKVWLR